MPAVLSLDSARAIALILNALAGLIQFYERDYDQLNVDGILGLRLAQGEQFGIQIQESLNVQCLHALTLLFLGQLEDFTSAFAHKGLPNDIVLAMQNISQAAAKIAERAIASVKGRRDEYYAAVRSKNVTKGCSSSFRWAT